MRAAEGPADEVPAPAPLDEVVAMMRRLRVECGWKAAQTHRSLARHLLEETHELVEVLDQLEADAPSGPVPPETRDHLREELGDVLLQVLFHAAIAEESGWFDVDDVATTLRDKLLRRNPHVFGKPGEGLGEQDPVRINELWEQAKAAERPRDDLLDGIAPTLPALATAAKVLGRRDRAGLAAPAAPPPDGDPGHLGDRLLALVAEANARGVDPEQALRDALRRLPS